MSRRPVRSPREVPCLHPLRLVALRLRPREAVRDRAEVRVVPNGEDEEYSRNLQANARAKRCCKKVKDTAREKDGVVKSGEVVMQEQLAVHEEEWEVVQEPAQCEESADGVVLEHRSCEVDGVSKSQNSQTGQTYNC